MTSAVASVIRIGYVDNLCRRAPLRMVSQGRDRTAGVQLPL
jgi:hypothetical protein